jgi:hypothetical protein
LWHSLLQDDSEGEEFEPGEVEEEDVDEEDEEEEHEQGMCRLPNKLSVWTWTTVLQDDETMSTGL